MEGLDLGFWSLSCVTLQKSLSLSGCQFLKIYPLYLTSCSKDQNETTYVKGFCKYNTSLISIYSSDKYSLSICNILDAKVSEENKTGKVPALKKLAFL